jgi:thiamine biosynthesis protein ThiS
VNVIVNGESRELADGVTVAALLELLRIAPRGTAVELNFELVPRTHHAGRRLAEGDRLEVVTLVGGG